MGKTGGHTINWAENISITGPPEKTKLSMVLNKVRIHGVSIMKFQKMMFQGVKPKKQDFLENNFFSSRN